MCGICKITFSPFSKEILANTNPASFIIFGFLIIAANVDPGYELHFDLVRFEKIHLLIRKFSDQQVNFFKTNHFLMVRTSAIHKLNQPW